MQKRLRLQDIRGLIRSHLWAQILTAMVLAVSLGSIMSPNAQTDLSLSADNAEMLGEWFRLPGQIFLNIIQMVVVALVSSSIILGITSSSDPEFLKRAASRIVPYFVATSTIAVLIGASVAMIVKPGNFIDTSTLHIGEESLSQAAATEVVSPTPASAQIADLIPSNLLSAALSENMLQIVMASLFAGIALVTMSKSAAEPLLKLFQSIQEMSLKIVGWAMRLAPFAVFGLILDFVLRVGISALLGLSAYIATVIGGLILLLCMYLLIAAVLAGRNPVRFASQIIDAQLLAFSTSSSAATMPLSMRIAEDRLRVSPPVARFIIPLGATVNMDGTALYQVVAALFITQLYGVVLAPAELAVLIFTVVGASIGSPSTPGVGIVILATILQGLGIPSEGVAILLGVDRILDMCRTSVNVSGDLTACVVMDRWLGARYKNSDAEAA
ncbi:dicarboxylate/amino acid:cation symporter [Ponticaulis sp.]|uniref:dicarboxylate/amino acid:cation symporter n=1 Tax=Ponticaulis sp. TaxID=2020902 RepID=UPI000B72A5C0|nr:dicarboxylate/amino acid:cation symporter [Ponticaulis sp.]MAI91178.1 C4-dicarboxylate transporter [Ponticaulis sp.]OUX98492.1 MAG: C4-dicarboxylate transporter [Hyphomonadaceae bacterium TMED5]|tara:strand:+ start:114756 stop:116081 length:1326 start_codon:yes stop_codon:yes gene_type:complete